MLLNYAQNITVRPIYMILPNYSYIEVDTRKDPYIMTSSFSNTVH